MVESQRRQKGSECHIDLPQRSESTLIMRPLKLGSQTLHSARDRNSQTFYGDSGEFTTVQTGGKMQHSADFFDLGFGSGIRRLRESSGLGHTSSSQP